MRILLSSRGEQTASWDIRRLRHSAHKRISTASQARAQSRASRETEFPGVSSDSDRIQRTCSRFDEDYDTRAPQNCTHCALGNGRANPNAELLAHCVPKGAFSEGLRERNGQCVWRTSSAL